MTKKLWEASGDIKLKSNLFKYENFYQTIIIIKYPKNIQNY